MINVLFGMLGFLLGWVLFYAGYRAGRDLREPAEAVPQRVEKVEPTVDEAAQLEKERERLRAEQRAFHDLIGYSADVAYGRVSMPGEE